MARYSLHQLTNQVMNCSFFYRNYTRDTQKKTAPMLNKAASFRVFDYDFPIASR